MVQAMSCLTEFKDNCLKNKSTHTVKAYMSDISKFNIFLKDKKICFDNVTSKEIEEYTKLLLNSKTSKGKLLKPTTINRKIMSIKRFIDFLNNSETYSNKIFVEINFIKIQKQHYLDDLLSKAEYDRIVNKAIENNDRDISTILKILYFTGIRVSELLSIKPEHIMGDYMQVYGKGKKIREVILCDEIFEILNNYIKKHKIRKGNKMFKMTRQNIHYKIKKYAGKCRIKLAHAHAHNFRHLYAIQLLDSGASLEEVAALLGHEDINTTRIYLKKTRQELKSVVNKL